MNRETFIRAGIIRPVQGDLTPIPTRGTGLRLDDAARKAIQVELRERPPTKFERLRARREAA